MQPASFGGPWSGPIKATLRCLSCPAVTSNMFEPTIYHMVDPSSTLDRSTHVGGVIGQRPLVRQINVIEIIVFRLEKYEGTTVVYTWLAVWLLIQKLCPQLLCTWSCWGTIVLHWTPVPVEPWTGFQTIVAFSQNLEILNFELGRKNTVNFYFKPSNFQNCD